MLKIPGFLFDLKSGTHQRREVIKKLESLIATQSVIILSTNALLESQAEIIKASTTQLERSRPSALAWIQATFLFLASGSLIIISAILTTQETSIGGRASALHQSAQAYRVDAVEQLVEQFGPIDQVTSLAGSRLSNISDIKFLKLMALEGKATDTALRAADTELTLANRLDSEANALDNESTSSQLLNQIMLGIGSALFGAMLGWIITQGLAELRWRKTVQSGSDKAS
jgi:hypothetical protein